MAAQRQRNETFEVRDGFLIREVVPRRGDPYTHRCSLATFKHVVHAIDELGGGDFTLETLVADEDLPFTQVAVALAFLKERGIIDTRFRRNYAATHIGVHLDAMTEYHALEAGV